MSDAKATEGAVEGRAEVKPPTPEPLQWELDAGGDTKRVRLMLTALPSIGFGKTDAEALNAAVARLEATVREIKNRVHEDAHTAWLADPNRWDFGLSKESIDGLLAEFVEAAP